jgi:hypothetical protein
MGIAPLLLLVVLFLAIIGTALRAGQELGENNRYKKY